MVVKSFRGLLADGAQDRIRLQTNDGRTGYRVVKFELFPAGATSTFSYESFVSIFKVSQTTIPGDGVPDFSDNTLLACGYYTQHGSAAVYPEDLNVIFDKEVFNQDIFITHSNSESSAAINYYIELEVMDLSSLAAEYTTLKDIRARNTG
jgi:hypothetical protein